MSDTVVREGWSKSWGKSCGSRLVAAPMMGRTDAAGCAYLRQVLPQALLFTEMIPSGALVHGGERARARLQEYFDWQEALQPSLSPSLPPSLPPCATKEGQGEGQVQEIAKGTAKGTAKSTAKGTGGLVLQLGGCDPALLAEASAIACAYPFSEINLNLGCPSPRVTKGGFGACLMKEPDLAARLVEAMKKAVAAAGAGGVAGGAKGVGGGVPISVKTRIGVDEGYDEESLQAFVATLCNAGCDVLYLHARKAWLKGVSAKENRNLPPLEPHVARRVQEARPSLPVFYNGGVQNVGEAEGFLDSFAGVMVGRALWRAPCEFADRGEAERPLWRKEIAEGLLLAVERVFSSRSLSSRRSRRFVCRSAACLLRRAMSLYHGEVDAGEWRRRLQGICEELRVAERGEGLA